MTQQNTKDSHPLSTWIVLGAIGLNLFLLIFFCVRFFNVFSSETQGVVNTSAEQQAFFVGLYFAIPSGIVAVYVCVRALLRKIVHKPTAWLGIVFGAINILLGISVWIVIQAGNQFSQAFAR